MYASRISSFCSMGLNMTYNKATIISSVIMLLAVLLAGFAPIVVTPIIILPLAIIYLRCSFTTVKKGVNAKFHKIASSLYAITLMALVALGVPMVIKCASVTNLLKSCTETVQATIHTVAMDSSNSFVVLDYDFNGENNRVVHDVTKQSSYVEGDMITIRIDPSKPSRICSTKLSTDILAWELLTKTFNI